MALVPGTDEWREENCTPSRRAREAVATRTAANIRRACNKRGGRKQGAGVKVKNSGQQPKARGRVDSATDNGAERKQGAQGHVSVLRQGNNWNDEGRRGCQKGRGKNEEDGLGSRRGG